MVQFLLPKKSRVQPGKIYRSGPGSPLKRFYIYRYDPDKPDNPRLDRYDLHHPHPTILAALRYIKETLDGGLTFRCSCREGICGTCAMNINGVNTLACMQSWAHYPRDIIIYPLPHMPIIKDLVPDLTYAYAQYELIQPWLKVTTPPEDDRERRQSPQESAVIEDLWTCMLCFCCSTSCPSYWWNGERYLGPATLLQARRWIDDSRDEATDERLDQLNDTYRLYRCHTILNCAKACPIGLNPAKAIAHTKRDLLHRNLE